MHGIELPDSAISALCERWGVAELASFGSILWGDFRADGDTDVLVSFRESVRRTSLDLEAMAEQLEGMTGRGVDIVSRRGVEISRNPMARKAILDAATVLHATR